MDVGRRKVGDGNGKLQGGRSRGMERRIKQVRKSEGWEVPETAQGRKRGQKEEELGAPRGEEERERRLNPKNRLTFESDVNANCDLSVKV